MENELLTKNEGDKHGEVNLDMFPGKFYRWIVSNGHINILFIQD